MFKIKGDFKNIKIAYFFDNKSYVGKRTDIALNFALNKSEKALLKDYFSQSLYCSKLKSFLTLQTKMSRSIMSTAFDLFASTVHSFPALIKLPLNLLFYFILITECIITRIYMCFI